jgi:hypothetical protein
LVRFLPVPLHFWLCLPHSFPPLIRPTFLAFFPSVHILTLLFTIPPVRALAPAQAATRWRTSSPLLTPDGQQSENPCVRSRMAPTLLADCNVPSLKASRFHTLHTAQRRLKPRPLPSPALAACHASSLCRSSRLCPLPPRPQCLAQRDPAARSSCPPCTPNGRPATPSACAAPASALPGARRRLLHRVPGPREHPRSSLATATRRVRLGPSHHDTPTSNGVCNTCSQPLPALPSPPCHTL